MTGPLTRRLQAVGALAVLLAVIVGVPALLLALSLVPHSLPTLEQVLGVLRSRDNGQIAEVVLAAGVWLCWALFTASTAAEIVALGRRRSARRLPGLQVFQRPAAALVTAVAIGFTVAPTAVTGVSSPSAEPLPPLPVATAATILPTATQPVAAAPVLQELPSANPASSDQPPPAKRATTYVVQRHDTLWAIAERYLGDPLRYPEIVRLNPAAVGSDNEIIPGTVLTLPPDATGLPVSAGTGDTATGAIDVTVHPGDTLWDLTEEVAGTGVNWPQVWAANRGRTEPGGAAFTDPSLIRPGWTLTIATSEGHAPPADVPAPVPPASPPPATPTPQPSPAPTPPAGAPTPDSPSTTVPSPSRARATAHEPSGAQPSQTSSDALGELSLAAFTGGGLLLAGLSLAALLGYRRRQFRHRRPGRTIASAHAELLRVERAVHSAGSAAIPDVTWLDQALRSLAQCLQKVDGARLPDVIAACLTDDVLTLVLTKPSPDAPQPWTADPAGTRWSIRRSDPLPYDEHRRAYAFAPYPTLASVGRTADGEHWLLDLERVGALSLSGDTDRCLDLARFLAAELAHNVWSEMLHVSLVGFGKELTAINPDRLTYTDQMDQLVTSLGAQLDSVTGAQQATGVDVLTGRLHDIAGDVWAPHVALIAPHPDGDHSGLQRLLTAIGERPMRNALALVVVEGPDHTRTDEASWQLTVDDTGTLHIPALGVELVAAQIPADEAGQLARMLALAADTEDRPIPPAHGDQPWDAHADACGGLRRFTIANQAGASSGAGDSVLPHLRQDYLDRAATTEDDLAALAPATDDGVRDAVEAADPTLDADLADWADPSCPRPKLTLLGPVAVRAQGRLPDRNPRRRFYTEIVAYLATRPHGVSSEQFATALWPSEPDILGKTKVRQALSAVRAWLGRDPATGADYLPSGLTTAGAARYRIHGILVDAELFRRLRLRGQARGSDGIADLRAALDLVTGKPLDVTPARRGAPGGYGWLIEEDHRLDHDYAAMIVDVAHTVATHHLAAGEPAPAAAAAQVALRAGSFEDVPLLDLVAACDAQGNRAEADAYVARILTNHDAEVEEDLPPRTAEILFRRQWPDAG